MRAYRFGQKWEIVQKLPALTDRHKADAAIPIKPYNASRNQQSREDLEPFTTNAQGGVIRESRRTRGFCPQGLQDRQDESPKFPTLVRANALSFS